MPLRCGQCEWCVVPADLSRESARLSIGYDLEVTRNSSRKAGISCIRVEKLFGEGREVVSRVLAETLGLRYVGEGCVGDKDDR